MSLDFHLREGERVLELGGGANPRFQPNCDVRQCFDAQGKPTVDFLADLNEPLPIGDEDFSFVFSQYALEHVSYRKVPQLLREVFRILKPDGRACFVTANTEAQVQWLFAHPQGWDGKNFFDSASCVLFGDQDYPENSHKCYFSPGVLETLFKGAGFAPVSVAAYGERATDVVVYAAKPGRGAAAGVFDLGRGAQPQQAAVCGAPGPGGKTCQKPKGHPGKHAA